MTRKMLLLGALVLLTPALLFAGTTCATPTIVPSDGRVVDFDFVAPIGANFYQFSVTKGSSYSVEVRQDYDDVNTDLTVTASTDCVPTALTGTTDTTSVEPALPSNSTRFSFTAAASGVVIVKVSNANASTGRYVSVSASETTQYNVRWSTFSGFVTQWGFQNTTSATIHASLTATTVLSGNGAGSGSSTVNFTVNPNSQVFLIIGNNAAFAFNVGANKAGFAVLTSDGPPGALLTDAFFLGGTTSPVIVPSVFQPVRQGHTGR
jgi:hypothetical protein